jgi:putative ABC transport system permease protein
MKTLLAGLILKKELNMNNETTRRGGFGILVTIAYRNIWRNLRRTAFCITAVGIAVFFIIFYQSFINGMMKSIHDVVQVFELGHVRAVSAQYEAESEYMPVQYPVAEGGSLAEIIGQIEAVPGVKAVFPRISAYATLQENIIKHATLWGLKINDEVAVNNFNLTDRSNGLVEGRYPAPDSNECAVGVAFAQKAGLKIGDRIPLKTVSAQFSDKMWSPTIVGLFSFDYGKADKESIIVDFSRLQRLLVLEDATQQLVVYTKTDADSIPVARAMRNILGDENIVREWRDNYWVEVMDMAKPLYVAIYLIFLVVACFLIINTVMMIIHERIKEIGMMGSLGMTRSEIVQVFFFESVFLSVFGALAGVVLGGLLTGVGQFFPLRWTALTGDTFSAFPAANALFMEFSPISLFQSWLLGVGVASIFTLIPSLKSAFIEPVEALRR